MLVIECDVGGALLEGKAEVVEAGQPVGRVARPGALASQRAAALQRQPRLCVTCE